MINLLTSASQFLSDTENFNSTTDKLLSSLFDGFIFYLAVVVFIITVLIITAKYRKNPTLGKRKSLTAITVLLTVFDSLLLLFKIDFFQASLQPLRLFHKLQFHFLRTGNKRICNICVILYRYNRNGHCGNYNVYCRICNTL